MGKVGGGMEKGSEVATCLAFSGNAKTKCNPLSSQGKRPAGVTQ